MFTFLIGLLIGTLITGPLLLLALLFKVPLLFDSRTQHNPLRNIKRSYREILTGGSTTVNPHGSTRPAQPIPHIYPLLPNRQEEYGIIHHHLNTSLSPEDNNEIVTTDDNSTQVQTQKHHHTANDITKIHPQLIDGLQANIISITQNALQQLPQGESFHWFTVFYTMIFTAVKQVLQKTDADVLSTCAKYTSIPVTGTTDTTAFATAALQSVGSTTILPLLNKVLLQVIPDDIPFLGATRVTHVDFGSVVPLIHKIQVQEWDSEKNLAVVDLEASLTTNSIIEVLTSLDIRYNSLLLATMPAEVALGNIFVHFNLRLSLDLDLSNALHLEQVTSEQQLPSASICLLEAPTIRFDITSALGATLKLTDVPAIHTALHKALMIGLGALLVAPNYQSFDIPAGVIRDVIKIILELAVGPDPEKTAKPKYISPGFAGKGTEKVRPGLLSPELLSPITSPTQFPSRAQSQHPNMVASVLSPVLIAHQIPLTPTFSATTQPSHPYSAQISPQQHHKDGGVPQFDTFVLSDTYDEKSSELSSLAQRR